MRTNGEWLRFNHEYHQMKRDKQYLSTPEMRGRVIEWARKWRDDPSLDVMGKDGYRKSWRAKVSDLIGEQAAMELMYEVFPW